MKKISMLINAKDRIAHINPEIYGHFSEHLGRCIYDGIYVGENSAIPNVNGIRSDVVKAFRDIKLPVLRWPGGCFADEYHWKDGIGEKLHRKKMINTNWGGVTEDNSFGTHEFFDLCEQVGCEPYITGNVGSGTVQELAKWVEYMTFDGISEMTDLRKENGREKPWKLKYLGIGNENWGGGGNMRPEYYADVYRHYQTYCKDFSGNELFKIACGPSADDFEWMEVMMKNLNKAYAKGIALHYYTIPDWDEKGFATEFDTDAYFKTISCANYMDTLLTRHTEIMNRYDPENEIGLVVDEWGCWYEVEPGTNPGFLYQQNTMRDAMVAAITLNIFNRHSKRVVMANLAQVVNVLQSIILTNGDKMVKTPTYHVFELYKEHQNGEAVYCYCEHEDACANEKVPMISSSASVKNGVMTITLANCSLDEDAEIACTVCNFAGTQVNARILTGEVHAFNDFDTPEAVTTADYKAAFLDNVITVKVPACSVVAVTIS